MAQNQWTPNETQKIFMEALADGKTKSLKQINSELGKEIKELNVKYNDLANDVSSSKNDFKSVSLVVDAIKEFKTYYDCVDDLQKKKFMLGVIIDKIRWNGDTDKVDIEF